MGRSSAFTVEIGEQATRHRRNGLSVSMCAQAIRVADSTLRKWVKDGMATDAAPALARFSADFRAAYPTRVSEIMEEGLQGVNSEAAKFRLWWLSRTAPAAFGEPRSDGKSKPRADSDLDNVERDPVEAREELMRLLDELPADVLRAALAAREG